MVFLYYQWCVEYSASDIVLLLEETQWFLLCIHYSISLPEKLLVRRGFRIVVGRLSLVAVLVLSVILDSCATRVEVR